jgi:hypothetical protein
MEEVSIMSGSDNVNAGTLQHGAVLCSTRCGVNSSKINASRDDLALSKKSNPAFNEGRREVYDMSYFVVSNFRRDCFT